MLNVTKALLYTQSRVPVKVVLHLSTHLIDKTMWILCMHVWPVIHQ